MEELVPFLEANKKDIVDRGEAIQTTVPTANDVFTKLVNELVAKLQMSKYGQPGVTDKAHIMLATAILQAVWCGWLSQAKANRGAYEKDWPDKFEEAIIDAVHIGRQYASTRP